MDNNHQSRQKRPSFLRESMPIIILIVLLSISWWFVNNPKQAKKIDIPNTPTRSVDVIEIRPQLHQINIASYGRVQARTNTTLMPQVAGEIVSVSENFRNGAFFKAGEALLVIDDRDYRAAVLSAEADLLQAQQTLLEQKAEADVRIGDWRRSGNKGKPPILVTREPQVNSALASVKRAQAQLNLAKLDLERTTIRAPYSGRILSTSVDRGQLVSNGLGVAEIYATDALEVRLPIKQSDIPFLPLEAGALQSALPTQLVSEDKQSWLAQVVRSEAMLDTMTQQVHLVAEFSDKGTAMPRLGQYLHGSIEGRQIENAIVIPTETLYKGAYVYVFEEGLINRRPVDIAWRNDHQLLIENGLKSGDLLVTNDLGSLPSGTRARINENTDSALDRNTQMNTSKTATEHSALPKISNSSTAPQNNENSSTEAQL